VETVREGKGKEDKERKGIEKEKRRDGFFGLWIESD